MIIFSPGGRQLINAAVDQQSDPARKYAWDLWAAANPRVRRAGDPWDDGRGPLPQEIVEIALSALGEMARRKRTEREMAQSEDDIAILDNDLSRIKAVVRLLTEGPPAQEPMA
jgi:hypothetical protein